MEIDTGVFLNSFIYWLDTLMQIVEKPASKSVFVYWGKNMSLPAWRWVLACCYGDRKNTYKYFFILLYVDSLLVLR